MLPPFMNQNMIQPVTFYYQDEIWASVNYDLHPDISHIYYVSTYGRVFSSKHCIFLTKELTNAGYHRVNLIRPEFPNNPKHISVHRLVLETFYPIKNMDKFIVNHKDGIKTNNFLYNLEWTDSLGNTQHAIYNNLTTWLTGDNCSWSTITSEIAEQIAQLLSTNNYSYDYIANMFGCSKTVVKNIKLGIAWREYYEKYQLWKLVNRNYKFDINTQVIIEKFIIDNISKYSDNYRTLCMDICNNILHVKLDRSYYIQLMDIIFKIIYN